MKKLILAITFLLFIKLDVFAVDACDRLVPQYANFMGKVTMGSNLRDYPCVYKSNVLGVSKIGETYKIISKVDGWYQIELENSKIYRIWEKAIQKTNYKVPKISERQGYVLTTKDNLIINKFVNKIIIAVQKKGLLYRESLVFKISEILQKKDYSSRLTAILVEIKNRVANIKISSTSPQPSPLRGEGVEQDGEDKVETHTYNLENIDVKKVKDTWLSWYNSVRKNLGKSIYSYDSKLEQTALDWSKTSKNRGEISHRRNARDSYYDYDIITSWFKDRGVECKNIYRATHTENIGWGQYKCNDGECTNELINAIRSTFDMYMDEKDKDYDAHYRSIIHSYFTKMGLGIELEKTQNGYYKYYLTVHYCTELIE